MSTSPSSLTTTTTTSTTTSTSTTTTTTTTTKAPYYYGELIKKKSSSTLSNINQQQQQQSYRFYTNNPQSIIVNNNNNNNNLLSGQQNFIVHSVENYITTNGGNNSGNNNNGGSSSSSNSENSGYGYNNNNNIICQKLSKNSSTSNNDKKKIFKNLSLDDYNNNNNNEDDNNNIDDDDDDLIIKSKFNLSLINKKNVDNPVNNNNNNNNNNDNDNKQQQQQPLSSTFVEKQQVSNIVTSTFTTTKCSYATSYNEQQQQQQQRHSSLAYPNIQSTTTTSNVDDDDDDDERIKVVSTKTTTTTKSPTTIITTTSALLSTITTTTTSTTTKKVIESSSLSLSSSSSSTKLSPSSSSPKLSTTTTTATTFNQKQNIPSYHHYNFYNNYYYYNNNNNNGNNKQNYSSIYDGGGLQQQQQQRFNRLTTKTFDSFNNNNNNQRNGTESLPRTFQPSFFSKKSSHHTTLKKQNLYQKSLSIFTNGVSPLLRKKKSSSKFQNNHQQQLELDFNNLQRQYQQILQQQQFNKTKQQQQRQHYTLSSSTLGLSELLLNTRRKSEPIMFSYDSITNELSKFQQREENIVKNINLDFEKMLMNDTSGGGGVVGVGGGNVCGATSGDFNNTNISQTSNQFINDQTFQTPSSSTSTTSTSNTRLQRLVQQQQQFNNEYDHYGKTISNQFISQQQQQQSTINSLQQQSPQSQYKESFYMVYDDNRKPPPHPQQQLIHHHQHSNSIPSSTHHLNQLHHHHLHHHHHNDDNIYEEIDFLTLSSLRAQYADTLSLQSYKKKNNSNNNNNNNNNNGGSKRSLASSSFTRWFSTRKKNSPSISEDENPYIDIKLSKKQRPPIQLPELPSNELTKEQLKRRYIIGTIVDSENSYINSLQRIINLYKKPLEESCPSILSQNKINIIFHRLEQILQCHTIFGIALSQCVREWDEKEQIGDVFIASFSKSMVLDIYSDFINNFTNAMETARKSAKSKSSFQQFLQEKSLSSPDRLSFFGLMVKPVQRFPQFILLLSDLLKHTPSDHHDRMSLQLALTQLESLADRLNERKRDAERHFAVKQLLKDYLSSSTTNSSNRYLLRQDDIYQLELDTSSGLVMKTKCRKLYLLNDMLVCVSVPANRLKYAVSLQDVDVMDDVTPATNNLIANSMLKSKDSTSTNTSPKHCTVERMYCDLNSLIHDLEVISRVTNLLSSLRYQYQGISIELIEQIGIEIREEIRKKDAQITLIDRSCLQIRIRSKNYKDIICIQMSDPETKKDWLTDIRLAKLALDRSNNPAWDIINETITTTTSIATRNNMTNNSIIMHRVPLFVKSLPIFATTENSILTCALHYRINRRDNLILENNSGILWICNVNENGSQLGALATNGTDISLIHSYELCDSHVTCIESIGSYAVWIGLRQGRIIVIDASSPGEWQQFAALDVSAEVTCIKYFNNFVYVGLITGVVALFNATHYEEPIIITLSNNSPVTCLLPVNKEMFACCGEKIWIINNGQLNRSYYLNNNNNGNSNSNNNAITTANNNNNNNDNDQQQQQQNQFPSNDDDIKPNLLAHCGIGLWVSLVNSSIIKLYHTETFKHLQDVNVASNVKRILNDNIEQIIFVTSMLATRGLLWIGTNVGVIVTLNLPRLQGVPLISGCLNVALHRHTGPVTILLNLTQQQNEIPIHPQNNNNNNNNQQQQNQNLNQSNLNNSSSLMMMNNNNKTKSMENIDNKINDNDNDDDLLMKNDDVESIYGLYSDLMNVENYVRVGNDNHNPINLNNNNNHHHYRNYHMMSTAATIPSSSTTTGTTNKMTWDLANLNLSDDSTSESAIYQDGLILQRNTNTNNNNNTINQKLLNNNKRRTLGNEHLMSSQREISNNQISGNNNQQQQQSLSPAKSQNSIYDTSLSNLIQNNNDVSSSSGGGLGGATSLYDIAPYNNKPIFVNNPQLSATNNIPITTTSSSSSSSSINKTALLMTGGNGYKRISLNEQTYSSQHAHCCIWEYKL